MPVHSCVHMCCRRAPLSFRPSPSSSQLTARDDSGVVGGPDHRVPLALSCRNCFAPRPGQPAALSCWNVLRLALASQRRCVFCVQGRACAQPGHAHAHVRVWG
eukprot:364642-Chlamydomonas_euryale.AAC.7